MIKVYGYPNTRMTRITWMLEELEWDYDPIKVDFEKGESQSEAFLAVNPAGKVPVLDDGGFVLTESAAILTYLGDKAERRDLVPQAGTKERALFDQWCCFVISELEQPLWTIAKHKFALPKSYRVPEVYSSCEWEFQKILKLFCDGLGENEYILGDTFSGADIMLSHTLMWAKAFKQPLEQPVLGEYLKRTMARPAFAKALQREKSMSSLSGQ